MRKVDSFFVLILILISGLTVMYKSAQYDLSGLQFQVLVNEELKRQIQVLNLQNKELELRHQQLLAQKSAGRAVRSTASAGGEVEEVWVDPDLQAQKILKTIEVECKKRRSQACLQNVDSMVTQFPSTTWAGQGLVHLANYYAENRKMAEAREILYVISSEFKKDKVVQKLKDKMVHTE